MLLCRALANSVERKHGRGEEQLLANEPRPASLLAFRGNLETGLAVPKVAIWMLLLVVFMDSLRFYIAAAVLPLYAGSLGISYAAIGWCFSISEFASMLSGPVLGILSDRLGRRDILLLSLLGAGFASVALGEATSFSQLLFWCGFGGIWENISPVAKMYLADVCSQAVLPDYMAYVSSVPGAAQTFGTSIMGVLATFGFRIPLLINGGISFAIFVLAFLCWPEPPTWQQESPKSEDKGENKRANFSASAYWLCLVGTTFSMGLNGTYCMLPIILSVRYSFDPAHVGFAMSAVAIMWMASGIWIAVPTMRWLGKTKACAVGSFTTGSFLVIAAYVQSPWLCIAALTISRMASSVRTSAFGVLQAEVVHPKHRGRIFSIIRSCQYLGKLFGPLVTGYLAEVDVAQLPFLFSGVILVGCSLVELSMSRGV